MKTAVEWFAETIIEQGGDYVISIFEQAKEMEKQQIVSSYRDGRSDQQSNNSKWFNRKAKQYYNETFK